MMMMSIEWHLLAAFMLVLALAFAPLFFVAMAMFLTPVALAIVAALPGPDAAASALADAAAHRVFAFPPADRPRLGTI